MRVSCHIFCMHHLKWCMCAVLWLQFAPSFYHHDPSIFNYIRYCLKWMFLLHSTSPTHISLTCSLAHSLRSSHNHAAISLRERKPKCTDIAMFCCQCQCCQLSMQQMHMRWFHLIHLLVVAAIFHSLDANGFVFARSFVRCIHSVFFCLWSLIFSFCFSWFSFCTSLWFFVMLRCTHTQIHRNQANKQTK